jgi:methyl-accepting chemotaxis protein
MFNSLKKKILASIILITSICTTAFMGISYYEVRRAVINQMKNDGATLIAAVSREIREYKLNEEGKIRDIFQKVVGESKGNIVYVSLVDTSFNMLISSDKLEDSKDSSNADAVDDVSGATEEGDISDVITDEKTSGFIFKTTTGERVYNVSTPFYEGGNLVGSINIGISLHEMYRLITAGLLETLALSVLIQTIAVMLGIIISRNLTRPLNDIIKKLEGFSEGDFTVEFESRGKDEVKKLTDTLNSSLYVLRNTITGIKSTVAELNQISGQLGVSGETAASSSREVSGAVKDVFTGVNSQALNISEMAQKLEVFGSSIDRIQNKVEENVKSSDKIKENADAGAINLNKLVKSIEGVRVSFNSASGEIKSLREDVIKINEITDVINSVAEQTNLLALNAAIEAARAGEAGRGFAVVAGEVRKLAEQVLIASKGINGVVAAIEKGSAGVAVTTGEIELKMDEQITIIEQTVKSFNEIQGEVDKALIQMKEEYEAIKYAVDEKSSILNGVESVSAISEEVAAAAKEIASSSDGQLFMVDKLSDMAKDLNTVSENLTKKIEGFKVK